MSESEGAALRRLLADSLIRREHDAFRTTRRWQGAMARAAVHLYDLKQDGEGDDLRLPIAFALIDVYGPATPTHELAALIEVMLPIEAHELHPTTRSGATAISSHHSR